MALCLPRSSTAAFSATRPTTWLSASRIYHLRSTCSALALKVFIGSRKLSHAAPDVSKIFAVIFGDIIPPSHWKTPLKRAVVRARVERLQPRRQLGLGGSELPRELIVLRLQH